MIEKILIRLGTAIAILGAIGAIVTVHVQAYDKFQLSDFALFITSFDFCLGVILVCIGEARR
jgi:hypothetical protein